MQSIFKWDMVDEKKKIENSCQKQPCIGVLMKSCSENLQQTYRRIHIPKCHFNKVALSTNEECRWKASSGLCYLNSTFLAITIAFKKFVFLDQ